MATITLRIDDQVRDGLEALARGRGVTVSDILRESIFEMLGMDVDTDDTTSTPLTLTVVERRHLMLQHEILARLDADDEYQAEYHRRMIDVLTHGYTGEYHRLFDGIYLELNRRDCKLVWDLLDMFRVLKASLGRLNDAEKRALGNHAEDRLSFRGFDFNDFHEGRLADHAKHLIITGRLEELAEHFNAHNERGNSHFPMLATYQRMLNTFIPIWASKIRDHGGALESRYILSPAELRAVIDAWPHQSAGNAP